MGNQQFNPLIRTVKDVDLRRYVGMDQNHPIVWYEKARKDTWFQRGMVDVTASYYMKPDGTVSVVNRGYKNDVLRESRGEATPLPCVIGQNYNCESKSRFNVRFSWLQPKSSKYGNYLILDLIDGNDPHQYDYALVSNATGSMVWILGKTEADLPEEVRQRFFQKLRSFQIETYTIKSFIQ